MKVTLWCCHFSSNLTWAIVLTTSTRLTANKTCRLSSCVGLMSLAPTPISIFPHLRWLPDLVFSLTSCPHVRPRPHPTPNAPAAGGLALRWGRPAQGAPGACPPRPSSLSSQVIHHPPLGLIFQRTRARFLAWGDRPLPPSVQCESTLRRTRRAYPTSPPVASARSLRMQSACVLKPFRISTRHKVDFTLACAMPAPPSLSVQGDFVLQAILLPPHPLQARNLA